MVKESVLFRLFKYLHAMIDRTGQVSTMSSSLTSESWDCLMSTDRVIRPTLHFNQAFTTTYEEGKSNQK